MNANDLSVCLVPNPKMEVATLKWFTFPQNNSGGSFTINDDVDIYVIIQAHNAVEANELAQRIGIYFHGVNERFDCECCGDRWYSIWSDDDGNDVPMIYRDPVPCWSNEVVMTVDVDRDNSVKVYPYSIISNR